MRINLADSRGALNLATFAAADIFEAPGVKPDGAGGVSAVQ